MCVCACVSVTVHYWYIIIDVPTSLWYVHCCTSMQYSTFCVVLMLPFGLKSGHSSDEVDSV